MSISRFPTVSDLALKAQAGGEKRRGTALYGRALALGERRLLAVRAAGLAGIAAGAVYLAWRAQMLSETGALGCVFWLSEVATYAFTVLTVVLLWRPCWCPRPPAAPFGTLDVFVPVCGESASLVERTLRAALEIDYPKKRVFLLNDGCRAGKSGWQEINDLGHSLGVEVLTRTAGPLGKAGNLNHGLRHSAGEFVAVIDADHCAVETFAKETLGYFADPAVALVCTPQQFSTDPDDPLNNRELLFYQLIQAAKNNDNAAFSCGNASLYRRRALDAIDGFSEWGVVEDLHTSYRLHAAGYRSAYHGRAVTTGLAPETTAAYLKQRLTWATDGLRIFLWDNPLRKPGLTLRQRLHYAHTTGFYLVATLQLVFIAGPSLYLLADIPMLRPDSPAHYAAFGGPYYACILAWLLAAAGPRGAVGALQACLALCPTYALALGRASLTRPQSTHVTAKGTPPRFTPLLLPQQLLFLVLVIAMGGALVQPSIGRGAAAGWAAYSAFGLSAGVAGIARRRERRTALRTALRTLVTATLVGATTLALVSVVERPPSTASAAASSRLSHPSPTAQPPTPLALPVRGVYFGVYNPDLLRRGDAVRRWNRSHGVRISIAHWYQQWGSGESRFRAAWASMVERQGAVPMITWEPWAKPAGAVVAAAEPRFRLARIAAGEFDSYIRSWARAAATYGRPILLRPMHEMNGNWYPWSIRTNRNTVRVYVRAWRRIVRIFRGAGATNVSFVWTVNSFAGLPGPRIPLRSFYPGGRYVDWVSMTGFNWGTAHPWNAWRSFDEVFATTYKALRQFGKPIMISEIGTSSVGGNAAAWIRDGFARVPRAYPRVRALVWFDSRYPGGVDFRLHRESAAALRRAIQSRAATLDAPLRFAP